MAAPTAMPAKPICSTQIHKVWGENAHMTHWHHQYTHLWDRRVNDAFVSILLPQASANLTHTHTQKNIRGSPFQPCVFRMSTASRLSSLGVSRPAETETELQKLRSADNRLHRSDSVIRNFLSAASYSITSKGLSVPNQNTKGSHVKANVRSWISRIHIENNR